MTEFDAASAIDAHRELLQSGGHLFSALQTEDVEVEGADLVVELTLAPELLGPRGALQGGLVATLADIVGGRIAQDGQTDRLAVTSDMTIHYLAPVLTGPAHAVGKLLRRGRRVVVVRVDIYDGPGGPLAAACTLAFAVLATPTA